MNPERGGPSPEEIAEFEKKRALSDAELINKGAEFAVGEGGAVRLEPTSKQIDNAKRAEKSKGGSSEVEKAWAEFREKLDDLATKISAHKQKMRDALQFRPGSENNAVEYESLLQELSENEARLAGVANVATDYRWKKIQGNYDGILAEKRAEILDPIGLRMAKGAQRTSMWTEDHDVWDYLEYQGKKISGAHEFLRDPALLTDKPHAAAPGAERKDVAEFKASFGALPENVQKAAVEWVRWVDNTDGVGFTVDLMFKSGAIKQEEYDEIKKAHAEGKKILWKELRAAHNSKSATFFWAIVDDPERSKEYMTTIFGKAQWQSEGGEWAGRNAANGVMPLLDSASSSAELQAVYGSIVKKLEDGTQGEAQKRHAERAFTEALLKKKWFPDAR